MSQINPFTGSILQSPQVQRQQAVETDRHARKSADRAKDSALTEDQLDHQVESAEELTPIHKDGEHDRRFKQSRQHKGSDQPGDDDDSTSHLDLTA